MTAAIRLLLSLFVSLALLGQAGAALSASAECANMPMMATGTMADAGCPAADTGRHASLGKPCKAAMVCAPTIPVVDGTFRLPDPQYQRFSYSRVALQFILQDFPRTLLRPPRLI